jgi:hypothetical protein
MIFAIIIGQTAIEKYLAILYLSVIYALVSQVVPESRFHEMWRLPICILQPVSVLLAVNGKLLKQRQVTPFALAKVKRGQNK